MAQGARVGWAAALALLLAVSCTGKTDRTARPLEKPQALTAAVKTGGKLASGRVSTKSGEILVLEPDGSVTTMQLDSAGGRDAFDVTEADLAALNVNLDLDLSGMAPEDPAGVASVRRRPPAPSAQQKALAAFRARTRGALPDLPRDLQLDPALFAGATVARMESAAARGKNTGLIQVDATLQRGVDAEVAFAYATCALAGWAAKTGTPYARHVRTLQDRKGGRMHIESVFTLSDSAPLGLRVMKADQTVSECKSRGIPVA